MLPMQRHDAECDACVPACTVGQPGFLRATRAVRVLDFLGSILLSTTLGPGSISLNVRFRPGALPVVEVRGRKGREPFQ